MTADTQDDIGRFTMGPVIDVARVLQAHGYGPFDDARSYVEAQKHLFQFLDGNDCRRSTGRVA